MKTTKLPSVEEVVPKEITHTYTKVKMLLNQDRDQAYTSLVEGIEGKLYEAYCEKCDSEREYCDCTRDDILTDILENVVKPLYRKE